MDDVPIQETRDCETGCGKLIVWAVYHVMRDGTKKRKPLDYLPSANGRYTLSRTVVGGNAEYVATELKKPTQREGARLAGQTLHESHGLTCPNRDKWMRTKGRK
jgi:hypothetical protein